MSKLELRFSLFMLKIMSLVVGGVGQIVGLRGSGRLLLILDIITSIENALLVVC